MAYEFIYAERSYNQVGLWGDFKSTDLILLLKLKSMPSKQTDHKSFYWLQKLNTELADKPQQTSYLHTESYINVISHFQ